jgi:hypothetical protein
MMDAKTAWHTWRKILRDESLQQQLFTKQWQAATCGTFTPEEQAVISAYAENIARAKWFIENYQFRLVNSFINALENGAPLTLRALLNNGLAMPDLSRQFLRAHQWHDYGPQVYTYCRDALQWLIQMQQTLALADPLVDLMQLEYQAVSLYLSLAHGALPDNAPAGYSHTGMARLYRSKFKLSQWLRNKKSLGVSLPEPGEENLLVVMPDLSSRHKYLLLPTRSAELFSNPHAIDTTSTIDDLPHLARLTASNALMFREAKDEMC